MSREKFVHRCFMYSNPQPKSLSIKKYFVASYSLSSYKK